MLDVSIDSRQTGWWLMQNNLFAPPRAIVADVNAPAPELAKPKAVWLLQGVAVLLIVGLAVAALGCVAIAFWHESHPGWPFALVSCAIDGLLLFGVVLVLAGSKRRHPLGRRLGLILIALLILSTTAWAAIDVWFILFFRSTISRGGPYGVAELVLQLAVVVALVWWFRMFGYSPQALAWFGLPARPAPALR